MPQCFQLLDRATGEPAILARVDDAMCEYFDVTPDPKQYYRAWFDIIGFQLALGRSWGDVELIMADEPEMLAIIEYLSNLYEPRSWYSSR